MRDATDSQNGFLAQPIIRIPAIEVIGKLSIALVILRQIGIQQVDRDGVPGDSFEIVSPRADHHRPAFNGHLDYCVLEHQKFFERPGLVLSALNSLGIEMLLEISFAMQQRNGAESQAQIGCGPHRVSCKHTQSPAVRGHVGGDGDFHRKVSYDASPLGEADRRKIALLV